MRITFVIGATILSCCPFLSPAQEVTASLSGVIKDASGAVVASATVTAVQLETNFGRSVHSSGSGDYSIPFLPPGHYKLTVAQTGFKTYERDDIRLEVNQHANIDVALEVGAAADRVTVSADAPIIQTQDVAVASVVNSDTIVNTPLNGRLNITGLMTLAPGIQNAGAQDAIPAFGVTPSIGGASPYGGIDFSIDGATNTTPYLDRGFGEFPPLDGIREFKVITSGAMAEFGKPAQVVLVTKSGTNDVHGTALEYNRNRITAAKNFFAESLPLPQYNRNEFGGNLSGPITIPKVYSGKNRSFFFFNYEGFRRRQASTVSSQVPTAAERTGDFSAVGTIKDPFTGAPFSGNSIPQSRLNPVTVNLQNALYPLPNKPGTGTNLVENVPLPEDVDRTSFRLDHSFSEKDQISGSFMAGLLGPNPSIGATSKFGGMAGIGEHNYNQSIAWNHVFSPTLIAETRFAYMHVRIFRTPQNYNLDVAGIIPGLGPQAIEGAPQVTITNITSVSEQGSRDLDQTISFYSNVTKTHGAHTIKAGFEYFHGNHWNYAAQPPQRGSYSFNGQYSGIAYSDFLLGYPTSTQLPLPSAIAVKYNQSRFQMYVQDDWRVTPNFTINVGLRYELSLNRPNAYGAVSMFVPGINKVVVFADSYPPATIPSLANSYPVELAKDAGLPSNIWDYLGQDTNNVAPRLGMAYKIGAKTVVRAAFGMFYAQLPMLDVGNPISMQLPFAAVETFSQPTGTTPTITMSNPFPGTGTVPANPVVNVMSKPVAPYTLQWNYALERELPRQIGVRIGYVGQRNVKEDNFHGSGTVYPDLNAVVPAPGNPQVRRPIQPFSTINYETAPIFQSTSNSLQVGIHKRFSGGLLINGEYQWTRSLGIENIQNPLFWNDSRGNLGNIRSNVFQLSYAYELPIGKGKPLFGNVHGAADVLVSGWVISGISSFLSGAPFSVSFTTSVQGSVGGRASVLTGANLYPANQSIAQWFNPAAFFKPPEFSYGSSAYNMLWGPGQQNWDASLAKNTRIGERVNLQLRLDAFSVFNHPQFSNPSASISNAATVGTITSATGNRTVQIGAKLQF
jgi:hypothetical protein